MNCPICGISEDIPSPDHDHRANFTRRSTPSATDRFLDAASTEEPAMSSRCLATPMVSGLTTPPPSSPGTEPRDTASGEPTTDAGRKTAALLRELFAAFREVVDAYNLPIATFPDDPLPLILAIEAEARAEPLDEQGERP